MDEVKVSFIDNVSFNQFGANDAELVANALEDAGLLCENTLINDKPAKAFLKGFFLKRDNFRESTMLGNILVISKIINAAQLNEALRYKKEQPEMRLGEALVALNMTTKEAIETAIYEQTKIRDEIKETESTEEKIETLKDKFKKYLPF